MAVDEVFYTYMLSDTMPYPRHDSRLGIDVTFSFLWVRTLLLGFWLTYTSLRMLRNIILIVKAHCEALAT